MIAWDEWALAIFLAVPVIVLWVYTLRDLFLRDDLDGAHKVPWALGIIGVPLVGALVYLTFRPSRPEDIRGFGTGPGSRRLAELLGEDDGAA